MRLLSTCRESGITILRVCGASFDARLAREFILAVENLEVALFPIIVDLSAVDFIDTSGLGALCRLTRQEGTRPVCLAGVSRRLASGLARVPWEQLPHCHDTLADAVLGCQYADVVEEFVPDSACAVASAGA
jgi:anti-anti-sigma regulatory factor